MLVLLREYVNRERESERERERTERDRERDSERDIARDRQRATYCTHIMTRIHVLNTHTLTR
jgi:hypothetical protein